MTPPRCGERHYGLSRAAEFCRLMRNRILGRRAERPGTKKKTIKELRSYIWFRYMSQLRPNPTLERSAEADLFRNTLLRIPTVFQRLAYLASLRDPGSGIYSHHGLVSLYGQTETRKALSQSHKGAFQDWLNLSLAEKTEDVQRYLTGLDSAVAGVLEHWRDAALHGRFLPKVVHDGDKELFLHEFEILLEILADSFQNERFSTCAE
jgi:hypothetical protein